MGLDMNLFRVFQIGNLRIMKVGYLKCKKLCEFGSG